MEIGFFVWPFDVALVHAMAKAADDFGYDMVGIADTPGNAMDPWIATTLLATATRRARVAVRDQPGHARPRRVGGRDRVGGPGRSHPRRARHRRLGIGVGHSGTLNLGMANLPAGELAEGVAFIKVIPLPTMKGTGNPSHFA